MFGTLVAVLLTIILKNTLNTDVSIFLNQNYGFAIILFYMRHFKKERKSDCKEKLEYLGKKEEDPLWGRLAFVFHIFKNK